MSTQVDVVDEALEFLGEPHSTGAADTRPLPSMLYGMFEREATRILSEHPWNFATKLNQLAATSPTPDDWDYGFAKPAGCVRIIMVNDAATMKGRRGLDYEDQGGRILTNSEETWLRWIDGGYISQLGSWPNLLLSALAQRMAYKASPSTSLSDANRNGLMLGAERSLSRARLYDAQQGGPEPIPASTWQRARMSGRGTSLNYE